MTAPKPHIRGKIPAASDAVPTRAPRRWRRRWTAADASTLLTSWSRTPRQADHDIRTALQALRSRARLEAQNNDHIRQFLRLCKVNVIGSHGIRLQCRATLRNGRPNDRVNRIIEEAWRDWGRRGSCDVTGVQSWRSFQAGVVETVARDGEAIVRRVSDWPGNRYGFALQQIDPESLDVSHNETLANGARIIMGVELDQWRRPIAYHLMPDDSVPDRSFGYRRRERVRVPADEIYHCYLGEWVWQTRGVPWTASALLRAHMLGGYEEAEVTAARVASAKMGFYTQDESASTAYVGDDEDAEGNPVDDVRPGEIPVLPPGWDFKGWDPSHPTTAYSDFVKGMLRGIASGLGVSYNTLAGDLESVNYSSLRQGALMERDVWRLLQTWMIECFLDRVYRDWIREVTLRSVLPLPAERVDEFERCAWQPRGWQWVDPEREVKANERAYGLRTRSISDIIREQGREPDEVWDEIARDEARMAQLGVAPPVLSIAGADAAPDVEE